MLIVAGVAVVTGALVALNETRTPGYVVPYSVIGFCLLTATVATLAALLLIFRRTRTLGSYGLIGALTFFASLYAGMVIAHQLGAWDEPILHIGGRDFPTEILVVFKPTATADEVGHFVEHVIGVPDPRGGHSMLPGMQSLAFVEVDDHQGYAIRLVPDVGVEQKRLILARARSSSNVFRVLENVVPSTVKLPNSTGDPP